MTRAPQIRIQHTYIPIVLLPLGPQSLNHAHQTPPQRRPLLQLPILRIPLLILPERLLIQHAIHLPIIMDILAIPKRMVVVRMVAMMRPMRTVRAVAARVDRRALLLRYRYRR